MSVFSKILEKIGIKKAVSTTATTKTTSPVGTVKKMAPGASYTRPAGMPEVDVIKKLEGLAKGKPGLDWKVSIVDLLKLLDIDSSYDNRKELAVELGCPADKMNDSASMNVWLHKEVLRRIAQNGGNIPANLID